MTETPKSDLDQAMADLLEQELMAAMVPTLAAAAPPPPVPAGEDRRLEDDVLRMAAQALRMPADQLDPNENLANFGVDSIAITEIMAQISRHYSIAVAPTTFFEARHLNDLARILRQRYGKAIDGHYAAKAAPAPMTVAPVSVAPVSVAPVSSAPPDWLARHRKIRHAQAAAETKPAPAVADIPIAIIAAEGMFPQSPDLDAFAAHLRAGDDCIAEVPPQRWDWRAVHGDPRQGPFTPVNTGGFIADVDLFDAAFFRIAPKEAELIDPQHRLFMQCVWSLIERGGYAPGSLAGQKIGLFLGLNLLDYTNMANRAGLMDAQQMTGLGHAFCPNRLSFLLDIHGPSEIIDTACSSSLVALNRAILSIRHEGCAMAIAGGSNLMLSADQHIMFSQVGMLAADGRCKTFSAQADGYARADGVGAVLLKRLDLAEADGDPILGVIRACVEQHGGITTSLTAPNPQAQARMIVQAHRDAGIDPRSITLIECHGTGTSLGDPVEIDGLKTAFAQLYADHDLPAPTTPHCGLGSVKSNIGHTETAAGVAGLIKVLLALDSATQYRSLHCDNVNPLIDLAGSPFYLLDHARPWQRPIIDGAEMPRRAGLSSFGAGGTNVHVVIEEYRLAAAPIAAGPRPLVVPVSAHGEDSLRRMVAALRPLVAGCDLDAFAHTLQSGRDSRKFRIAFVVADAADLLRQMDAFLAGTMASSNAQRHSGAIGDAAPAEIARRWMAGESMDWSRLDQTKRRRLTLPGTRFVGKRFWLPQPHAPQGFALHDHGPDRWRVELREESFFLTDHRLGSQAILPGVAYLELTRAACVRAGLPATALRNVVWIKPMAVSGRLNAEITLHRAQSLVEIASLTADGDRVLHAQIRLGDDAASAATVDLASLQADHPRVFAASRIYAAFDAMDLRYGPGHRAISQLSTSIDGHSVLARLDLPPSIAATLSAYPLHPSLLDGAFQAAIGVTLNDAGAAAEGAALPFAVNAIDILGPCTARMWVHVYPAKGAEQAQRVRSLDMDLYDHDGGLRVRLRGFATRLPAAAERRPDLLLFTPHWHDADGHAHGDTIPRLALLADGFAALPGWTCHHIGTDFAAMADTLLGHLQNLRGPTRLGLVIPQERPELAGLAGMLRSAGLEMPGLHGQTLLASTTVDGATLAHHLDNAAASGALLRLNGTHLQVESWQPMTVTDSPAPWKNGKVYLITGGLGGLGRLLAEAIRADAPQAIIALAGRSSADAAAQSWIDKIGADYHRVDLADAVATTALVDAIRRAHGRLDGILHAAGFQCDQAISKKTSDVLAHVLAPKVKGTVNLENALGMAALDFFVVFSSLSAIFGNPGQSDYAAANGFLDGWAAKSRQPMISIAWPFWAEGGMRMDADTQALMTRTTGLVALSNSDGLRALAAAIAAKSARVAVAIGDGDKIRRRFIADPPSVTPTATATMAAPALRDAILAAVMQATAKQLKVDLADLDADQELTEYGFDSIGFTQFANSLNASFDLDLTPVVFFEHPTLDGLAGYLCQRHGADLAPRLGVTAPLSAPAAATPPPPPPPPPPPAPVADVAATMAPPSRDAVAIIGMTGLFPRSPDLEAFWRNLEQGQDCIGEIPAERWNWRDYWGDPATQPGRCNIRWGGFIDEMAEFDAGFFGLSAPEARMMDPQQRLLLTQAWRLFENAGIAPKSLSGSDTGVFIGTADTGYGRLLTQAGTGIEGYSMTALAPSLGPNRISYHFNFHGPSLAVETACSSALVAVHRAVEAIAGGHCQMAIAGGVNALLLPDAYVGFAKAGMLAADGHCKPFSAAADGYARGEGIGLVLLKRLSAAERDGDTILGVIRASGENHGGRASSLTAPNPKAQADLLRTVHRRAGIDPRSIGYIEAHGTGTPLGDPIEVEALRAAFADLTATAAAEYGPAPAMQCGIGSVKSNIGHLELAAGIAGLLKVLLQLRHATLVKTLHCHELNPYLKLEGSPFTVVRDTRPWLPPQDNQGHPLPRRAGVSSFGFGGANAHVVVEEYPAAPMIPPPASGPVLLVLSAHTPDALAQWAAILRDHLRQTPEALADIAFTLQTGREGLEHRLAFVATSAAQAAQRLETFLSGEPDATLHQGRVKINRAAVSVLESDDEMRRAIAGLATRGRADGLAELWVRGLTVNWADSATGRRVALPPYPLARTRHWPHSAAAIALTPPAAHAGAPMPEPQPEPEPEPEIQAEETSPIGAALAALTAIAAGVLEVDPLVLDPDSELGEFGFDSITMTGFASKVNAALTLTLTPADFFEFATLNRLAGHIAGTAKFAPPPKPKAAAPLRAAATPERISAPPAADDDSIAIVGFSCRFPQALDGDAFWDNLVHGRDCISRIPADRWDWRAFDGDPKENPGKTNIHWGGFIDGVFEFDPLFFGISPREAKLMDPQQRLLMMHVWKAIEDCGHAPRSLAGRKIGLFVGTSSSGYRDIIGDDTGAEGYVATGAVPSVGPNRTSYFLDWHGPSEPVETACSSSLVALHRAVQSIRAGDCEMAVIGGVNTIVTPEAHINFAKAGMLSPDGRCKTFSADANGYVRGEGIGMIVLRRLSEAQRDGDPIIAVIKASAINHGGRANSLTAPNTSAQSQLIREALARAGFAPATIGYIEAHGTGTPLGDPVEINALKAAFGDCGGDCGIGSVKTNIGHLELAAGAAGIIKVLLQMRHRTLAPSLHCQQINPYIDLAGTPLRIIGTAQPWQPAVDAAGRPLPRRAGVSSFGFGGVNGHVILEEYIPATTAPARHAGSLVLVLSAHDPQRVRDQAANLLAFLAAGRVAEAELPDLAYTLQIGRDGMRHRLALVVNSLDQARDGLSRFLADDHTGLAVGKLEAGHKTGPLVAPDSPAEHLARQWVQGDTVDWPALYPKARRRLRLPTYPFARDVHHINGTFAGAAARVAAAPSVFSQSLEAEDFVLRDHRVMGTRILPGAMGLELARAAGAAGKPFAPTMLSRVVWQHPLRLDSGAVTITVPLAPTDDGGQTFRLLSGGPDSTPHMLGLISPMAARAETMPVDDIRARCPAILAAESLYATYAKLGLDYGPAFRPLHHVLIGKGEALARLVLPEAAAGHFGLNPSMVDGAFQAALGLFQDQGGAVTALPFGLDRLEALAPTTAAMWVHLRRGISTGGIHKLDLDLADDDGVIRLRLSGFTLREIKTGREINTGTAKPDLTAAARRHLAELVAREAAIAIDDIEAEAPFEVYGIDSIMIVRLTDALEADFGPLPKTLFFEYRDLAALAGYFTAHHGPTLTRLLGATPPPEPPEPPPHGGGKPLPDRQPAAAPAAPHAPIAIIGMSGRFPGARTLDEFWRNLEQGKDCIGEIPAERWDHDRFFDAKPGTKGKTNSKWGGFVDDFDCFDPMFFNIAPREAEFMDPQERLFLQCAWETLEDAGHTRHSLATAEVGVFVGVMYQEYQLYGAAPTAAGHPQALNGSAATIANRVSYFCGFSGPSMALDTMCSSSLTAIHLACEALRSGDCSVALAGGVNLSLHPNKYLGLAQGRFLASNGRCESFGQGGDGYVPGEAVGAVLLKPLADARRDGDRVLGIVRASAVNHGGKTNGYTVPNPDAQAAVIGKALERAGISARDIGYVEAHGTGTKLGDPIEIAALTKAYGRHTAERGFCPIGSVKSNIGHCESAAGMAGLAKVLLQMRHGVLAPSLHADSLNPGIDFAATPFVVQRQRAAWPQRGRPRLAGLSSFGAGGANAHLIIEEYPIPSVAAQPLCRDVYPLSARDPERLREMAERLRAAVLPLTAVDMAALAFTLQQGREAFEERLAIVATTPDDVIAGLDRFLAGATTGFYRGRAGRAEPPAATDADTLAAAWIAGARVLWPSPPAARRIALPPYPFARERYWLPGSAPRQALPLPPPQSLPLLFAPRWRQRAAEGSIQTGHRLVVLCQPPADLPPSLTAALAPAEVQVLKGDNYAEQAKHLLEMLQSLFKQRPDSALVQVVLPHGTLQEGLGGMLRSAVQERPGLRCQLISLDYQAADIVARLNADQTTADADIRHQHGHRLVRQWQELTVAPAPGPWRDGGVYMISGGAGGVGLHVCATIARSCRRPVLWLIGRSPLSAQARHSLDGLDADIHYRQADVTDTAALTALVDDIVYGHGHLHGIIHAAGLTRDSLLVRKSTDDLAAVLAPKVAGTIALDQASGKIQLDFFALFASVSGALGNAGQADYAAANAYLDAFAAHRNRLVAQGQRQGRTIALDWPYWQDGGMRLEAEIIAAMDRMVGARPLATAAAMATLDAALAQTAEQQILVLDGDHDRLRRMLMPAPATLSTAAAPERTIEKVTACFAEVLRVPTDKLTAAAPLDRFGVDSVSALEIMAVLERHFGPLPATLLFEHPSIGQLSAALDRDHRPPPPPQPQTSAATTSAATADDIAIIAVAGRYPGAGTVEEFWQVLAEGRDCVTETPPGRWDMDALYAPQKGKPGASHCKWGGFIDGIDEFDAAFFGYSPRAAALADPQERLFLQNTWHLLERAGLPRERLRRDYDRKVGVFVGAMFQHYGAIDGDGDAKALLALNSYGVIANKVSFFFDLQGPSLAIDCMCSSGLQAVHQACQSLKSGECRLAIAGGVSLSPRAIKYQGLSRAGLIGSHADSRAFADGDGYLPAEGVGAVLLKPLADALRDGDAVLAVIKASGANHGGHSAGFGVPSAEAQTQLISDTLRRSGLDPRSIGYIEVAASGAGLGDAMELRALSRAFGGGAEPCPIGSVKTNMGHAEAASGLAQLTKVLLQMQHRRLVASLRPAKANPAMDFTATPFVPQWNNVAWPRRQVDGAEMPRRAAISSFGAGGSNVHLILEEGPALPAPAETARPRRFPLSARTPEQLAAIVADLSAYVHRTADLSLARLSQTLCQGREKLECAVQIVAASRAELHDKLGRIRLGETWEDLATDEPGPFGPPLILPGYPFARDRHWIDDAAPPPPTPAPPPAPSRDIIVAVLAQELGVAADKIDTTLSFRALGVDSMIALRLGFAIEEATGTALSNRMLEDFPTPAALAAHLGDRAAAMPPPLTAAAAAAGPWRMPLTEGQKGLWVLQSLYPQAGTYNVPLAFRLDRIDIQALDQAWRHVQAQYPILTARVIETEDDLWLHAGEPTPLHRIELPKGMEPLDFARRLTTHPFSLSQTAPSRCQVLHGGALADSHEILLLTIHHMVFDGASAAVLATALWAAYDAVAAGRAAPVADGGDFADFAAWERALMNSARGDEQRAYWLQTLQAPLPVIELPADRPAAAGAVIDGQSLEHRLPATTVKAARRLATSLGITPAALFLGILTILLYRHGGGSDMVIGVPVLRRPTRHFATSIGYFVNMLALRCRVSGQASAADVLRDAHRRLMDGLDHGDYPFSAIARDLGGSLHGEPPYHVSYAYQNFPMSAGQAGFIAEIRQPGDGPFGLELYEDGDGLVLVAGYDGARFDAATIERLLERFARLCKAVCAKPDSPVAALELLSAAERKRLLGRWAKPEALPPRDGLLPHWIAAQAKATPDAIAVTADGQALSYRQLSRRAHRLARYLRKRGIGPGDAVAVLLGRGADSIVAVLATLVAGGIWVPLDADAPPHRLAAMLDDCGARIIITQAALAQRLPPHAPPLIDLEADAKAIGKQKAGMPKQLPAGGDAAYMIYTSGSTGTPKGVVVSHQAIADHCRTVIDAYGLTAADVVLQFAPHVVDTALEQILPALAVGARLLLRNGPVWTADKFRRILVEQAVTVADLPPAYLREVLLAWQHDGAAPPDLPLVPDLRLVIVGGEALPPDTVRLWHASPLAASRLLNAYGPTEATITCLLHDVDDAPPGTSIPIGRPLPGTEIRIVDGNGNPLPEGVIGELLVGGSRLALGYHHRPELNSEKFIRAEDGVRLYRTGDLAAFIPGSDGIVAFHGRVDHQVKIRGFRIELGEIETALTAFGLREAAVVPRQDAIGGQVLVAYVVTADTLDQAALRAHMAARLPPHMLPSAYVTLAALPLTTSGKLDRAALPDPASQRPGGANGTDISDSARDGVEAGLLRLWAKVLGRETTSLGVHDDFAACGGHSLSWLRLLSEIAATFQCPADAADFIHTRTIAEQATVLRARRRGVLPAAQTDSPPVALRPALSAALRLFLIHPVAGGIECYGALARRLRPDIDVVALADPGADGSELVQLARHHIHSLRLAQPHGPYHLAGWSMGGVLAFEMARQLRQAGEDIALLCLIDSYTPKQLRRLDALSGPGLSPQALFARDVFGITVSAGPDSDIATLLAEHFPMGDAAPLRQMYQRFQANNAALMAYQPAPCDVPVLLLRAEAGAVDDQDGWAELAPAGLTLRPVPGDHVSLLRPPNLDVCVSVLEEALASARKPQ
ncbi:non-ribosomal peptide synthetase [Magnetospirillum sulfuroxidans]|uniref:Amino acid adenylation domain-containing protein n=1 Tax=Magnetospirillum sulfuroxidans TaxID=611300 RepID=A0ABS5I7C8_9PROT|nr:non-ribosomal peptide synthetase [Magnetospirillum sulfuroxidans]MBR9970322.1 amino acid adenylation domain-containing protein [Magnetospirillum sulfuroxidans]